MSCAMRDLKNSPAMCGVVPMPAEANDSVPGFALAMAASSATLRAPTFGLIASTSGDEVTIVTVRKSFSTS